MPENTLAEILAEIDRLEAANPHVFVPFKTGSAMIGKGPTSTADLARKGKLKTITDGNRRLIFMPSIFEYMRERARASYAPNGDLVKVRQPKSMFRRRPRPRTEAELRGLAKGNAKRRAEGAERRSKPTEPRGRQGRETS